MMHALQQLKLLAFAAEWSAVVFSLLYVFLAAKQNRWCWVFGGISSFISIGLFIMVRLYAESLLYLFYVLVAIYGWMVWNKNSAKQPVTELRPSQHLIFIASALFMAAVLYYLFANFTNAAKPLLDSLTTAFSILTTFLIVKKVLSNWIYWLLIDAFSVYLYWSRGLDVYALLMAVYTFMAIYGFIQWRKVYKHNLLPAWF